MPSTSLFDASTFLETQHHGSLDTSVVLPTAKEYRAQTTDKIATRSGTITDGDRAGEAWASVELQWELLDEDEKKRMNMDKIFVRQNIMLDLDQKAWKEKKVILLDFGVNRNMRLKRLVDATGLNTLKNWNINMLKHQPGYVTVVHRRPEGFDDDVAEVSRVVSLKKAPLNGPAA